MHQRLRTRNPGSIYLGYSAKGYTARWQKVWYTPCIKRPKRYNFSAYLSYQSQFCMGGGVEHALHAQTSVCSVPNILPLDCIDDELLSGWLTDAIEPQTAAKLVYPWEWRLLIWDGHEPHMNFDVLQFCNSRYIKILKLPFHVIHVFHPLDLVVFSAFQHNYSIQHHDWDGLELESITFYNSSSQHAKLHSVNPIESIMHFGLQAFGLIIQHKPMIVWSYHHLSRYNLLLPTYNKISRLLKLHPPHSEPILKVLKVLKALLRFNIAAIN